MPIDEDYHTHVRTDVLPLVPRGGRLLDAGGGIGATARALREAGLVERAGVVDLVAARPDHGLDFTYSGDLATPGLLERIGEAEGPFDTVLALDFLEHLVNPWAMVERLHRLLRPGGCLIVSLPNVRHYSVSCSLLFRGEWTYQDHGILDRTHLRFFTRASAEALVSSSGLRVDGIAANIPPRRLNRWLQRLTLGRAEPVVAQQYVLRARN